MILKKICITAFGNLKNVTLEPSGKLNVLEAQNESGKSTLAAFLKFLFYGLGKASGKGELSDRDRYMPWDSGIAAGSAEIEMNGKTYLLERALKTGARGNRSESATIRVIPTGELLDESPDTFFLGVPETVFRRSAYVSQGDAGKMGGSELHEAIENILFSGDEAINTQKALKKLDDARVMLLHKNGKGGKLSELQNEMDALDGRLADAKENERELSRLEESYRTQKRLLDEKEAQTEKLDKEIRHTDALRRLRQIDAHRAAVEKAENARAEYERFCRENAHNGWLPGRDSEQTLTRLEMDLRNEAQKKDDAERKIERLFSAGEIAAPTERSGENEGTALLRKKAKGALSVAVIFWIIGALLIAAGVLVVLQNAGKMGILLLAAAVIVILLGVIFGIRSAGIRKKAVLEDEEQAKKESESFLREQASYFLRQGQLDEAKAQKQAAEVAIQNTNAKIAEIAANTGRAYHGVEELPILLSDIRTLLAELEALQNAKTEAEIELRSTAVECSDEEEAQLRLIVNSDGIGSELSLSEYDEKKSTLRFNQQTLGTQRSKVAELSRTLTEKKIRGEDPQAIAEQIYKVKTEYALLEKKYNAYRLAYEKLSEASDALRGRLSPTLSADASAFMKNASAGRYEKIFVDEQLGLSFLSEGASHDAAFFSSGTGDLAYISLRLALVRLLFPEKDGKLPPLIFDESFARLDDRRLQAVLELLAGYPGQMFLLTCHHREAELLSKITAFENLSLA